LIEIEPGTNGLVFRKISPDWDRKIGLFYITTDSAVNFKLQGMRRQFKALGFDIRHIEEFGDKIRKVLGGKYSALFSTIDLKAFNKTMEGFLEMIDQEETRI
jgi:hypothetical protein